MNEAQEYSRRVPELPDRYRPGRYFPGSDRAALCAALGLDDAALTQLLADAKGMSDWRREELKAQQGETI